MGYERLSPSRLGIPGVPVRPVLGVRHIPCAHIGPLGREDHFSVIGEQFDPIERLPRHCPETVRLIPCRDERLSVRVLQLAIPAGAWPWR
jgi:hypothetical protein